MAAGTTAAWWSRLVAHPARAVVLAFAFVILLGAALLTLPAAADDGRRTSVLTALFTSTGAITGGLSVVGTGSHWSTFGEVLVLVLIQVGGFGIMTLASLLGLLVTRRLRLRTQLTTQAETRSLGVPDIRRVVLGIAGTTLAIELAVAAVLALRFRFGYGQTAGQAVYYGFFHAISAFNNAGFGLRDDNLVGYADDPWIVLPIAVACVLGALGFPVLLELLRAGRKRVGGTVAGLRWSLHTRLTLATSSVLLALGTLMTCALEWDNPATLGPMEWGDKVLNGFFNAASARTAGFNTVDTGAMEPATLLGTCVLMFIGGGSAGTAGGIKVTTFAVLGAAILAEVRGRTAVDFMGRRIPEAVLRQALTVALLGVALVMSGTLVLLTVTEAKAEAVLFEAVSAFGTVGLSTGITGDLPAVGLLTLIVLMFAGRLGPITLASALALRERDRR